MSTTLSRPSTTQATAATPATPATGLRRRLVSTLVAGALLALGGIASVASAPTASAHDELTATVPADRSTVATAPDSVVLSFSETPLDVGLAVRVTGPTGDVQQGTARIDGTDVVQPLLPSAPAGSYRVAWRVTSEDGHASSGELTFTASAANARAATATPGAGSPATPTASPTTSATTPATTAPTTVPTTTPTTSPAVAATSATTSSGTSPVAIAVIVLVLAVLAGAALVLTRRARAARSRG